MTHKVHPKAFRIKGIEDFYTRGFYGDKMPQYLEEGFLIRKFLKNKFSEASIANIEIEHSSNKLNVIIETSRPGLIIGRGGEGVVTLQKEIEKIVRRVERKVKSPEKKEIKIDVKEIKNPWSSASLCAQMMGQQIERRIPFRQVLKKGIERIMQNREVKGVKVEVSGRLNGIEIARKEWLKKGKMPLGTIRADIDYSQNEAYCSYGVIGVKVWIYKGEKFN